MAAAATTCPTAAAPVAVTDYAYDNLHRLTSRSYPTAADNVAFAYDLLGRRTQAKYADNSHTINYVWDGSPTPRPVARGSPTTTIRRPMQSA